MSDKEKQVEVVITEHDLEAFLRLVDGGESFTWTFNGVDITFTNVESKVEQLRSDIANLKEHMRLCGSGSKEVRELHALEDELSDWLN